MTLFTFSLQADTQIKPFIMASGGGDNIDQVLNTTRSKLTTAGFEILGGYSPYPEAKIIVFTNAYLKSIATQSKRGGYGGALRVAITKLDGKIEVTYTNPLYWSNAYRLSNNLRTISDNLASTLGRQQQFGSGDEVLTESDMREYHYTVMMEYFDDPSLLAYYDDHVSAVKAVETHLASSTAGTQKVYRLDLDKDTEGKEMTLFGVGLLGKDSDDCSSDSYIKIGTIKAFAIPRMVTLLTFFVYFDGPAFIPEPADRIVKTDGFVFVSDDSPYVAGCIYMHT